MCVRVTWFVRTALCSSSHAVLGLQGCVRLLSFVSKDALDQAQAEYVNQSPAVLRLADRDMAQYAAHASSTCETGPLRCILNFLDPGPDYAREKSSNVAQLSLGESTPMIKYWLDLNHRRRGLSRSALS